MATLVVSNTARAGATRRFVVDPGQSLLRFLAVSRFMDATGSFARFGGEVRLDDDRPEEGSGRLVIDVGSLDTGNGLRDRHLRSADFFDAERHPTATLEGSAIRTGGDRWLVTGALTLRGVTRPLRVPVTLTRAAERLRVAGEVTLNRFDFAISYQSRLNPIRDAVRVTFDLTATSAPREHRGGPLPRDPPGIRSGGEPAARNETPSGAAWSNGHRRYPHTP